MITQIQDFIGYNPLLSTLIVYIISILISRETNKILYYYNKEITPLWQIWFIPIFNIGAMLLASLYVIFNSVECAEVNNKFTGNNWKTKND